MANVRMTCMCSWYSRGRCLRYRWTPFQYNKSLCTFRFCLGIGAQASVFASNASATSMNQLRHARILITYRLGFKPAIGHQYES